jgi:hypothetical protein
VEAITSDTGGRRDQLLLSYSRKSLRWTPSSVSSGSYVCDLTYPRSLGS